MGFQDVYVKYLSCAFSLSLPPSLFCLLLIYAINCSEILLSALLPHSPNPESDSSNGSKLAIVKSPDRSSRETGLQKDEVMQLAFYFSLLCGWLYGREGIGENIGIWDFDKPSWDFPLGIRHCRAGFHLTPPATPPPPPVDACGQEVG